MATNPLTTNLLDYVEQHQSELLTKSMLEGKSSRLFNLMTGVKGNTTLNLMDVDVEFQPLACGWNESGSTELSQRELKPAALMVEMAFCSKNLLNTYAQHQVKVTAGYENLPFEEKWTSQIVAGVNEALEKMLFQGVSGQTNQFEGLISIAENDANTIKPTIASGSTVLDAVRTVAAAIPAKVKNPVILIGKDDYFTFIQECVASNLFHYMPNEYNTDGSSNEYRLPGTDIRVISCDGLIGTHKVIAANLNNIYYGISADGDEDTFDLFFEPSEREFRLVINFIAGVQYAFSDEIVIADIA